MAMPRLRTTLRRAKGKKPAVLQVQPTIRRRRAQDPRKRAPRKEEHPGEGPARRIRAQPTATIKRAPREVAERLIFEVAIEDREGTSTGALGACRYGKTTHLDRLIRLGIERGVFRSAVIHDVKKEAVQFAGEVCPSIDFWLEHPEVFEQSQRIVFHAGAWDPKPTIQDVAEVAQAIGQIEPVACVADEVFKGTNGRMDWLKGPKLEDGSYAPALFPEFLREGPSKRISPLWATQIPQQLPTECRVLSRTVALFHLEGLSAEAALDNFRLGQGAKEVLCRLNRGEFLLFYADHDWDRTIYFDPTFKG